MSLTLDASRRSRRVFSWLVIQWVKNFFIKCLHHKHRWNKKISCCWNESIVDVQSYYENTYWYWIQLIQCLHRKCGEEIYKNTTEVKCKYTTSWTFSTIAVVASLILLIYSIKYQMSEKWNSKTKEKFGYISFFLLHMYSRDHRPTLKWI